MRRLLPLTILTVLTVFTMGCPFHVTHYRDDDGSLVYVGDFYNEGDLALTRASVEATLYDAGGNRIASASDYMCQILPAKGVVPFKVTFPPGTSEAARAEFKVVGTPTAEPYLATGLEAVVVPELKDIAGQSWVSGELRNTSANHYYSGYVCASWTNAAGDVLRVASVMTALIDFPPGRSLPFVLVDEIPPEAVHINFYLDAGVFPPGWEPFTVVTLPGSAFQSKFEGGVLGEGSFGLVEFGEIRNSGSVKIGWPRISATVRDSAGTLLAAGMWISFCYADVPPGSYTYGGYQIVMPGDAALDPQLAIEAPDVSDHESYRLAASGVGVQYQYSSARITGTVKNTSGKVLTWLTVCGAAYDSDGVMVGAGSVEPALPASGLAPGASVKFSIDHFVLGKPATAKAFASGRP